MSIDVVSFDLWGTLITYGDREAEAAWQLTEFTRILNEFGYRVDPAAVDHAILEVRERTFADQRRTGTQVSARDQVSAMTDLLGLADEQLIDILLVPHTHAMLRACPQLLPHARDALAAVNASGRRLVLTSNTLFAPGEVTRGLLDHLDIGPMFEDCFFSGDLGFAKPRPEVFAVVCDRTGVGADRIVHLGNEWRSDVRGPLSAGLYAIWFNPRGEPTRSGAPAITSLADAADAIEAVSRKASTA